LSNDRTHACGDKIGVTEIVIHPNYDPDGTRSDVAILKLNRDYTACRSAINFPVLATEQPTAGQALVVAGWGALYSSSSDYNPAQLPEREFPDALQQKTAFVDGSAPTSTFRIARRVGSLAFCALTVLLHSAH
jgi:hypothetical protein